jgi:dTDP-L-rhamnose 4-epimerase
MRDCIVITGGAGFIGCALSKRLEDWGLDVVAVDNLHPQVHTQPGRPERLPDFVELEVADIRDRAFWDRFLQTNRPKILIHFAAETGTGQSLTESARHAGVNVLGTTEILDALTAAGQKPDHILLSASRAVYGEGAWAAPGGSAFYPGVRSDAALSSGVWGFRDASGQEAQPLPHRASEVFPMPTSIYGATKLAQEHVLVAWAAAMSVPLTSLRFQNVYGPGQSPFNAYTGIINIFHRVARSGAAIDVYEDGQIGRDFVFIEDVVDACVAALRTPPESKRVLDVGSGVATTILEAAQAIARMHGAPEPQISGKFRNGDVRWAVAETADLSAQLGVRATVDFETGAKAVGEWLVSRGFA